VGDVAGVREKKKETERVEVGQYEIERRPSAKRKGSSYQENTLANGCFGLQRKSVSADGGVFLEGVDGIKTEGITLFKRFQIKAVRVGGRPRA